MADLAEMALEPLGTGQKTLAMSEEVEALADRVVRPSGSTMGFRSEPRMFEPPWMAL